MAFYVRTGLGSSSAYGALRAAVKELDSSMPVYEMRTLESQLDETLLTERLIALLSAGFGLLATLLAAVGLYGVMAFVVARRTKELGVRIALGAGTGSVIWLVMKEVLLLLSIGLAVGVPTAIGLGRFVAAQLYGVKGTDPWIAGATMIVLIAVSSAAGLIPARRASRIDPFWRCDSSEVMTAGERQWRNEFLRSWIEAKFPHDQVTVRDTPCVLDNTISIAEFADRDLLRLKIMRACCPTCLVVPAGMGLCPSRLARRLPAPCLPARYYSA